MRTLRKTGLPFACHAHKPPPRWGHMGKMRKIGRGNKKMQIPIKRAIEKVPGGMMVVPLLAGALIATFFPGTPKYFGSFTGALFSGALTILAVFYVCMGASIDFRATPYIVK